MESIHNVDVSWMTHNTSKSTSNDINSRLRAAQNNPAPSPELTPKSAKNGLANSPKATPPQTPSPKVSPHRPGFARGSSLEKSLTVNGMPPKSGSQSPGTQRRNSWLSSFSSKFSSSPGTTNTSHPTPTHHPATPATTQSQEPPVPRPIGPSAPKNAILQHAVKGEGDAPYTPAPPKMGQPNFIQSALRRLSSSGGQLTPGSKSAQHGLCERRVLNVDHHRERCQIPELNQSKLRKVSFCVDVEIANGPRYTDDMTEDMNKERKEQKRITEKGEGDALKHPEKVDEENDADGVVKPDTQDPAPEPPTETLDTATLDTATDGKDESPVDEKDLNKKKEKKKRNEEERKARKEKKRKLAEANGTLPVELVRNDSDSSSGSLAPGTPINKTHAFPTTDPARIYRRCCQLRETPILKKVTEQLAASSGIVGQPGVVSKLDLTGYWLPLPDLVTLGDYLAVVPVKELVLDNCGLNDEGVRVILAGLLAAKLTNFPVIKSGTEKDGEVVQGGVVERLVLKNNNKIGRDGWRYICLFINMCRSVKFMDLSQIPFPEDPAPTPPTQLQRTSSVSTVNSGLSNLFSRALGSRLAGEELELLNMAQCGINTDQLGHIVDGIIKSGLRRLGIAGNSLTAEGMEHVARFIKTGRCDGLDLGNNNLKDQLDVIANALEETNTIYALSLADCNLTPESLWGLFPALAKLKNFRFIDLSQNHDLFTKDPSAISLLRRYMPKMSMLKRIHLMDVSMTTDQAIALAEILPEIPSLAHVNLLENPQLAALANAKDESSQEEACALYTSLMVAVRVSKTIVCIDIEVPSNDSSEIVKALAKQVVAYSLWNLERPVAEISGAASALPDANVGEKEVAVPDVLLHLIGHAEGYDKDLGDNDPAPDEDYVMGGTGVVKALGICLRNRGNDDRSPSGDHNSGDRSEAGSGSATPKAPVRGGKAKDMSKNLLGSARKIRARLQPAMVTAEAGDRHSYSRLLFLDQTLERMIKRFEDEFPETRLPGTTASVQVLDNVPSSPGGSVKSSAAIDVLGSDTEQFQPMSDEDDRFRPALSHHNSDVSLASRALSAEEGRVHKYGQKLRRDIIKPDLQDHDLGTASREAQPAHLVLLRAMVSDLGGEELKKRIDIEGQESIIAELSSEASVLRQQLIDADPEAWEKFVQSQEAAQKNSGALREGPHESAVE